MTILLKQNRHFVGVFLSVRFWGEGWGLQKEYVLHPRENDARNGRPQLKVKKKQRLFHITFLSLYRVPMIVRDVSKDMHRCSLP